MMYVVVRRGVYDQGVVSITSLLSLAKGAAERAAEAEEDLYHEFEIRTRATAQGDFDVTRWVFKTDEDQGPRKWMRVS